MYSKRFPLLPTTVRLLLLWTSIWVITTQSVAAQVRFKVNVPNIVALGDNYQIQFILEGTTDVGDFTPPDLSALDVLYGPAIFSRNTKVSNGGKSTSSYTYTLTYTLQASKAGKYTIGSAQIVANGKVYKTSKQSFQITQAKSLQNTDQASDGLKSSDLFIRAVTNKKVVYEQEAVLVSLYVYSRRSNISGYNRTPPEFTDFITEEIPNNGQSSFTTENVQGKLYYKAPIWQLIAYPQKSGRLEIPAFGYEFKVAINTAPKDPSDLFSGSSSKIVSVPLKSLPIFIDVKPLPSGAPEGFNGLVGSYSISNKISTSEGNTFRVADPLTYTLTIHGQGNDKLLASPSVLFPDSFEAYAPQEENKRSLLANNVSNIRTIQTLLFPSNTGQYTIPEVKLVFFDPQKRQYQTTTAPARTIVVHPGDPAKIAARKAAAQNASSKSIVPAPLKRRHLLSGEPNLFVESIWFLLLHLLFPLVLIVALWYYRNQQRALSDPQTTRYKKAQKEAEKHLQKAYKELQKGATDSFYTTLIATIYEFLSHRFFLRTSELNRQNIDSTLQSHNVSATLRQQTLGLIDSLEQARYAPASSVPPMQELYQQALSLVMALSQIEQPPTRSDISKKRSSTVQKTFLLFLIISGVWGSISGLQAQELPNDQDSSTEQTLHSKSDSPLTQTGIDAPPQTTKKTTSVAPENATVEQAQAFFFRKDYPRAAQTYQAIVRQQQAQGQQPSAALYYNIGTAYLHNKQYGQAILWLQRAKPFRPDDKAISHNLQLARTQRPESIPVKRSPAYALLNGLCSLLPLYVWAIVSIVFFALCMVGLAAFLIGKRKQTRKGGFYLIWGTLAVVAVAQFAIHYTLRDLKSPHRAVVIVPRTPLRSTPNPIGPAQSFLLDGTELRVEKKEGPWVRVILPNQSSGWVSAQDLSTVFPIEDL